MAVSEKVNREAGESGNGNSSCRQFGLDGSGAADGRQGDLAPSVAGGP
jgi:hypothetical protein